MMVDFKKKLAKKIAQRNKPRPCLWQGPESDDKLGGVTQSMISSYLCCPERFRLKVVDGLQVNKGFIHAIEYGNMWHTCEEAHAADESWTTALERYTVALGQQYPEARYEIEKWYQVCRVQFPIYVERWEKHPDVKERTPIYQEVTFHVPYELPSERVVYLRGKWDSVDVIGKKDKAGIYLQENKSKGRVDEVKLKAELPFDLQSNLYLIALSTHLEEQGEKLPVKGVRYNVIRRPFGDRKNSIVQKKGREINKKGPDGKPLKDAAGNPVKIRVGVESNKDFYNRLGQLIQDEQDYFFMRWRMEIFPSDLKKFRVECLDPILENLCDDYEWWRYCDESHGVSPYDYQCREREFDHYLRHFRLPFGIYNPLLEGRQDDYIEYLSNGSTVGLHRVDTLFSELE